MTKKRVAQKKARDIQEELWLRGITGSNCEHILSAIHDQYVDSFPSAASLSVLPYPSLLY